jgi:signal transduction histidine kinase
MLSKRSLSPTPLPTRPETSAPGVEAALARAEASEAQAAACAEHAERLRTILETMADGVAVYDAAGRTLQVNRAYRQLLALEHAPAGFEAMTTYERVRLLDMRDAAGAPLPFEETPPARALRGEVVTGPSADIRLRAFDGRDVEVTVSSTPLRDREGHRVGAVCVLHDQTERHRLEREREAARADELAAREASRRLEAFLATAAHDLRTPLAAAVGYLDLAAHQAARLAAAAQQEYPPLAREVAAVRGSLEDAVQSTERLSRLLTLLFDTAAIRAGKLELRPAPCDLAALVYEHLEGLRVAAPNRSIRLQLPASGEPILVEADAERIGQVVANYVTNALKYAPSDRPVDVGLEVDLAAHGGRARVTVCDTGPGIPKEERAQVWELFHRAPEASVHGAAPGRTGGGGTHRGVPNGSLGLGLYISKAIIEAHGGQVGVKSAVGEGSTFWFTLPLAPSTTSTTSTSRSERAS